MKRYAIYDFVTKEFDRIVELDSAMTLLAAPHTEIIPSKAALKAYEAKQIKLTFDDATKKWKSENIDGAPSEVEYEEIKNQIDHFVRVKLRSGFEYRGRKFSTIDSKQHEYNEIFISVLLGITEFPIDIKGLGNSYITLKSVDDLKAFMAAMKGSKELIRKAGRILKYGGFFNNHECTPIASFSRKELDSFNPEEALNSLLHSGESKSDVEA